MRWVFPESGLYAWGASVSTGYVFPESGLFAWGASLSTGHYPVHIEQSGASLAELSQTLPIQFISFWQGSLHLLE
jgi:hypothetical protein